MAAVKKKAVEDKAVVGGLSAADKPLVAVTVGAGPIHHAGRRYGPGDTLEVSGEVAAALIGAGLVVKAGDG